MQGTQVGLIDVHHHALPPVYLSALESFGISEPVAGATFPTWSPELSIETMDSIGISTAILSITTPGLNLVKGDDARNLARHVNEYFAKLCHEAAGRFGAFALVPVDDMTNALGEVAHALDTLGLDGIGLYSSSHGAYLGNERLEPLMAELARRQVPAFVHPSLPSDGRPLFGIPGSVLEFPLETTRALTNMLFSGTLDRYPELRLVISHAGGAIPFLARRLALAPHINPALSEQPPRDLLGSLRGLHYDVAMSATPEQLGCLQQLVGGERILFGSDYPFMPRTHAEDNARGFRAFSGDGGHLAAISSGNCRRLFSHLEC